MDRLRDALAEPPESDLIRAGCIKYFEFCLELAWKSIKLAGKDLGLQECLSPKRCFKQAFQQGWIRDEIMWLQMLDARNRMSHTYDAKRALEIYGQLAGFLPELQRLHENLSQQETR